MKIQTRPLLFLLSGFVAFASVFAPINPDLPPEEKGMWEKAIEKYKEIHETQQRSYKPRDADFERYNQIERFEEKAWALAEQHGVFFVGKAQHRQPRPHIVEYFTSLVRPNDDLARPFDGPASLLTHQHRLIPRTLHTCLLDHPSPAPMVQHKAVGSATSFHSPTRSTVGLTKDFGNVERESLISCKEEETSLVPSLPLRCGLLRRGKLG